MLYLMLRREGFKANHERVERLYRKEGPQSRLPRTPDRADRDLADDAGTFTGPRTGQVRRTFRRPRCPARQCHPGRTP